MVLGELMLEGTSNQVLVVYYLGKAGDFQVRWMKTPIEIKHILKSSLEASFPALKGNFSEKTGVFFVLFNFVINFFFELRVPVHILSLVYCIKTFFQKGKCAAHYKQK